MFSSVDLRVMIKNILIHPLYKFTEKYTKEQRFYTNIGFNPLKKQKKILISYITASYEKDFDAASIIHPSNLEVALLIKTFVDLGFCVDIIHCRNNINLGELSQRKYDIVFGFGEPFYIACKNNPESLKIVYLTEAAPDFSKQNETKRIEYYYERHRKYIPLVRTGLYFKEEHIRQADIGILIGSTFVAETYKNNYPNLKIYYLPPTGNFNKKFLFNSERSINSKLFLWFGAHGIVHKGLDVLVDAFKDNPEANLFICGLDKSEERYLGDYKKYHNIHNLGFMNVQSDEFLKLINQVCYVILPSCSESMATSVLTCMRHGMIPVVTRQCGIDVDGIGYYCEDYHVDYLKELLHKLINEPHEKLRRLRRNCYAQSNQKYTLEQYNENINKILTYILKDDLDKNI